MGTTTVVDALGFGSRYVSNWANKPASLPNAFTDLIFIKDAGVGGSYWYWDDGTSGVGGGTPRYRAVGGQVVLSATTTDANYSTTATASLVGLNTKISAGLMGNGDIIQVYFVLIKPDITTAVSSTFRLGKNNSNADAAVIAKINAAASYLGYQFEFAKVSDTSIKPLTQDMSVLMIPMLNVIAYPSTVSVDNMSLNDVWLSNWATSTVNITNVIKLHTVTLKTRGA